jgi:hypothetical protein
MDTTEQLILDSEVACAVLGRAGEFVLIFLDGKIENAMEAAICRGWGYCGTLVVTKTGQPDVICEPDPDSVYTLMRAGLAFAQLVAERLRPKPEDDSLAWLEALHHLPDTRG